MRSRGVSGRILIKLTIEKDGSISTIELIRGVHEKLDNEAIRVVKLLKEWNPCKYRGVPVRDTFVLPINLKNH